MQGEARDLVFISYSHRDQDWLTRLDVFLKRHKKRISVWADPYIEVGDKWRRNISAALSRTCVAVLLVSPDFLASDFICEEELPPLLAGADAGVITVVAIPISAADYEAGGLSDFQFAHDPNRPLDGMRTPQRNAVFVEIVKKIVAAAQKASRLPISVVRPELPAPAAVLPVAATNRVGVLHGVPRQRQNYLRRQEFLGALKGAVLGPKPSRL